jgi:hypothetical protein
VQENVTEMEINYSKCGDGFSEQTAAATATATAQSNAFQKIIALS